MEVKLKFDYLFYKIFKLFIYFIIKINIYNRLIHFPVFVQFEATHTHTPLFYIIFTELHLGGLNMSLVVQLITASAANNANTQLMFFLFCLWFCFGISFDSAFSFYRNLNRLAEYSNICMFEIRY